MSDAVMVPRIPTEAMLMAARGIIMARDLQAPNGQTTLGDVARSGFYGEHWRDILTEEERAIAAPLSKGHFAQLIYRAMLAASPPVGGWERTDIQRLMDPVRAYLSGKNVGQRVAEEASERAVDAMYRALNAPHPAREAEALDILIDDAFEKMSQQPAVGRLAPETDPNHPDKALCDAAPPPPSVSTDNGSRPQEAVPTEGLSPLVVALCESLRDNDDPNEPIADNGASVIDGWRDLARRILSTPQPADGCSSNEGAKAEGRSAPTTPPVKTGEG